MSLDASRMPFDDPRYSFDEPRASWDGYLIGRTFSKMPTSSDVNKLAQSFQAQGNKLAEDGEYREALGKWETALLLNPQNAVLHEQKAQILLELGDAWSALKAASRV
ncbi:hypothetical protein CsatB_000870 [Cannabis sativa]|uniref:Tetratricopeptide repeat protein n=2 Tax=Cannabis sativa TaxID=3483 RepID=A0A7J6GM26_CANSA|nr:hypothetical protein F8388_026356 [Cannabis sativa]KAF4368128.1 hypothetical protein G4B88_001032 [Cannabis sativa]KAF4383848.1 hypothetical protein G4B88_016281 [Cannabis sativa]